MMHSRQTDRKTGREMDARRFQGGFTTRRRAHRPGATTDNPSEDKSDHQILKLRCSAPKAPLAKTYHITTDKLAQGDDYHWALDSAPTTAQEPTHTSPFGQGRPSGPRYTVLRCHRTIHIHQIFTLASTSDAHCKPIMLNAPYVLPGPETSRKSTPLPLRSAHSSQGELALRHIVPH